MIVDKITHSDLKKHVDDDVSVGCHDVSASLGFVNMPEGYALMLNSDESHYYWLNSKGESSCISWDKWAVYRSAKVHAKRN